MANELSGDAKRLYEIVKIIRKYKLTSGFTPDKLCQMLKELGPTFVKLGQLLSMHPEVIPMEYCKKLEDLRTDAKQLVTAQIREIISAEYNRPWNQVFESIGAIPLGCASIAQVHEAHLTTGEHVAIKIQRPDIYDTMERDVRLMKKALDIVKPKKLSSINNVMDISEVLDEIWLVAQDEMDFIKEAENIKTLRKNNEGIQYVYTPEVYDELTTKHILVMEYVGGFELCDMQALSRDGYDTSEVCTKLVNNFIKQFAEDRFFHADPHPGNVHIQGGQIVWLDLGMMGRLPERDAELITGCMRSIFSNDSLGFADFVLDLCEHDEGMDKDAYYKRMCAYVEKYRVVSMAQMASTLDIFADLYRIARDFSIKIPRSLTMFWRALSIMEGTVSELSPETDLAAIIGKHLAAQSLVKGIAGSITRSISHKKLISGKPLSFNGHEQEPDEETDEKEELE